MPNPTRNHKSFAVFICGKTAGKTRAENGDYVDIYKRFLTASLESHIASHKASNLENPNHDHDTVESQPLWQFTLDPYDVFEAQELPSEQKLDDYDAIIITGSPASAYDNVEWINNLVALTKHVADTRPRIKLIGICFGHQIIARALGGECVPNPDGWEVGPTPLTLTDLGKQIFGVESITLEEMHRDHVPADRIPPSFELLGATTRSGNQGMVRFLPSASGTLPTPAATPPLPSTPPHLADATYDSDSTSPPKVNGNGNSDKVMYEELVRAPFEENTDAPPQKPQLDRDLLKRVQIITVQGHPEWNEKVVTPLVEERSEKGIIPKPIADDAMRRRFWRNDGVSVMGSVIWAMLGV